MKSKAIPPFTLTAGQRGRILFDFTLPEGTEAPTLRGALQVEGRKVSMTAVDGGLMIPVLPAGVFLAEVRAGASCVLYGHVEVLASPLADEEGEKGFNVSVDLTTDVLKVHVTIAEGLPGKDAVSDANYDPESPRAQAGTAVAQAVDGLLNADEVENLLASSYSTISIATPAGTSNATCNYIELAPARVPTGLLTEISYRTGTNTTSGMTTVPLWLAVWELQEGSTTEYSLAGVSTNTITQAINSTLVWSFARLPLHGRRLRLIPTSDPAQTAHATCELRIRCSTSTDSTQCVLDSTAHNFTPRLDILALSPEPRFAPASHLADAEVHLTETQRQVLSCFEWSSTHGVAFIHTTDGVLDNRLQVVMSATGTTLKTSGTLTLQSAQAGIITRTAFNTWTDSSSGTSYNYGGHTMSESEMQPYGITEPCVWCGDPALPLLLRGSEIRINGNVIDLNKLTQLLTNADALLALIAPGDS